MQVKSFTASSKDIQKKWFIIDAKDAVIGRLAVYVANILCGKHKHKTNRNHSNASNTFD